MNMNYSNALLLCIVLMSSCNNSSPENHDNKIDFVSYKTGSFGYDLNFLKQHDSIVVLKNEGENAEVIVSPKYQAKVFTSTANGDEGASFGWVNYKAFTGNPDAHMNAYGGENRFWLGPEGGKFSLFFKPGTQMVFNNWKTPAPIDTESWNVSKKSGNTVTMQKEMTIVNYKGTKMQLSVDRTITILQNQQIAQALEITLDTSVKAVGYETLNMLTNKGANEWTAATGMPCMWLLDMFKPTQETVIVVPFKKSVSEPFNKIATTNYFGEIPTDRLKHSDSVIFLKADGKSRGKLGVVPGKAKTVAGSYDANAKILTAIVFDVDAQAKYLNQEWNTTKPSFSGDAVNAYNDGPLADGTQMGPFYEIESVSPAAFLKPGQSLSHKHNVFHFTGSEQALDQLAKKLFGVHVAEIKKAF